MKAPLRGRFFFCSGRLGVHWWRCRGFCWLCLGLCAPGLGLCRFFASPGTISRHFAALFRLFRHQQAVFHARILYSPTFEFLRKLFFCLCLNTPFPYRFRIFLNLILYLIQQRYCICLIANPINRDYGHLRALSHLFSRINAKKYSSPYGFEYFL